MPDDRTGEAGLGELGQERAEVAVRYVLEGDGEGAHRLYDMDTVEKRGT
jgi:hypothetical protein